MVVLEMIGNYPRKQFADATDWMIGDTCNDVAQSFGVESVQLGRGDQRVDCGNPFAATARAEVQEVPFQRYRFASLPSCDLHVLIKPC